MFALCVSAHRARAGNRVVRMDGWMKGGMDLCTVPDGSSLTRFHFFSPTQHTYSVVSSQRGGCCETQRSFQSAG